MKTFHRVVTREFQANVDFRIELDSHKPVFMRVISSNYLNSQRAVIEVDALRFLNFWRLYATRAVEIEIANGNAAKWRKDHKFQCAEDGFAKGQNNPVPLAQVGYSEFKQKAPVPPNRFPFFRKAHEVVDETIRQIGIGGGITRTIWLLANGATVFPIECNFDYAAALYGHVGSPTGCVKTVEDLLQM